MNELYNKQDDSTSELIPITPAEKKAFQTLWVESEGYNYIEYTADLLPVQDAFYSLATKLGIEID